MESAVRNTEYAARNTRYSPSWVDRLTGWVGRLPGPEWVYYAGAWLLLFAAETGVKWSDRTYPVGTFFLFHLVFAGSGVYTLALMHYLDGVAGRAFNALGPIFTLGAEQRDTLRYELTTMPRGPVLLASVAGVVAAVAISALTQRSYGPLKLVTSTASIVSDTLLFLIDWVLFVVLIYHTVRQLRIVNLVYTQHVRINLFRPGPPTPFPG